MKLTVISSELDQKRAITPDGMAFWAGTGPDRTTCRECKYFTNEGYYVQNSKHGDTLKPGPCKKFHELTNRHGYPIPNTTPSCKYFILHEKPPTIRQPRKG